MAAPGEIGDRLRQLTGGAAVALRLDAKAYADHYFAAVSATLRDLGSDPDVYSIFVSVTNPASLVWSLAQALDVPPERVTIVDGISHLMMNYRDPLPNATYIESPRMLEDIMLRVEYLIRKSAAPRKVVVIDSVNSLAIHNSAGLLNEFFHILLNNLKTRQVLTIVLAVSEDGTSSVDQMLSLIVDETIEVSGGS
jgi:hypothetical protein